MGRKKKSVIKVEKQAFIQPADAALQRLDERQELRLIGPEAIDPMPDSKREHIEQDPDWPEFVENVRLNGVMVPIHVRKHPDQANRYMLIAGERRWRAAMACNLLLIRSIVHADMTAIQAKELAILENYGRKDLTPIEESRCVSDMIDLHQGDLRAVAILFGKSEQWVRLRAKLQELSPSWLQGIGGEVKDKNGWSFVLRWGVGHYELIARLSQETQETLWKKFQYRDEAEDWTVKDLEKYLGEEVMHLLVNAAWAKDDATLGPKGAGACNACLKRSSCQGELFHEGEQPDAIAKRDRCLDAKCWDARSEAYALANVKRLRKEHPGLQLVATEYPDYYERPKIEKTFGKFKVVDLRFGRKACSPETQGAEPVLVVHGQDKGQLKWLEPKTASRSSSRGSRPRGKSLTEKRQMLDSRRWASVIEVVRERLNVIKFSELPTHTLPDLLKLVHVFGTDHNCLTWQDQKRELASKPETSGLAEHVWHMVGPNMANSMNYAKPTEVGVVAIERAKLIAQLLGMQPDAMFKAATLRLPDPKSWKKLADEEAAMAEKALAKKGKGKGKKKGKPTPAADKLPTCRECGIEALPTEHDGWPKPDLCPGCEEKLNTREDPNSFDSDDEE